jgi:glycosyltransferase involved in cell wall biosynthesis
MACRQISSASVSARGNTLAFLGRLAPEKGPEVAIRIANAADIPLRIAAKVPRGERRYFAERLEPLIDGTRIQLIGEVNDGQKDQCGGVGKKAFLSN